MRYALSRDSWFGAVSSEQKLHGVGVWGALTALNLHKNNKPVMSTDHACRAPPPLQPGPRAAAPAHAPAPSSCELHPRPAQGLNFHALHLVEHKPLGADDAAQPNEIEAEITEVRWHLRPDGAEGGSSSTEVEDETPPQEFGISLQRLAELSGPAATKLQRRSAMARAAWLGFKLQLQGAKRPGAEP